jgi:aminoglycoside 3-N-acetyltransferase
VTSRVAPPRITARTGLADDIRRIGVRPGDTVLLHSSLRAIGWVTGGARTVVRSVLDVLGLDGTLVVPTQTADNRDPANWDDPPVPASYWAEIRAQLPAFDPVRSPSHRMGAIAESVRTWPGAIRSTHPQTSFAGIGPRAAGLLTGHELESQLGESSPLARLEDVNAKILLLGVGFDRCTAFHLAEYRLPSPPVVHNSAAVVTPVGRVWLEFDGVALDSADFAALGADLAAGTTLVTTGTVGAAPSRLLSLRHAVAYAERWLRAYRI